MTQEYRPAPVPDDSCYHCGLPIPPETRHYVAIGGEQRRMCCIGCEAVAQAIVDNGLTDYYRHRDAMPEAQREAMPAELQELGLFDHPDYQKSFVRPVGEHEREASLILEGITCAACVWLNEQHVSRQPGVRAVHINYATRRARVRWDEQQIRLSEILAAIRDIGYRAYPYDAERLEQVAQRERRSALWRVFVAGFGMMQVMMYAIPAYVAGDGDMSGEIELLLRWASLVLTLPVVFYSAAPFFQRALRDLKLRRLGMDVPVALGVGSAFAASCWATLSGGGEVYFDSVTMFVFFLLCGRYLEMVARQRAVRGVEELGKVLPVFTERFEHWPGGEVQKVAVSTLQPGDVVRVRPGETVPADGVVLSGDSALDESLLTGESRPVPKGPGDPLTGGATNVSSPLVFRVQQAGDSTRLASIQRLMERAAAEKPRILAQADRVAGWFILGLLVLAFATAVAWYFIDPSRALWVFVSVLVVSCPCALSLATPAAMTVGTDRLARIGVLITRGHAIETLARATHFVFDKTGTLSAGRMRVTGVWSAEPGGEAQVRACAAALEAGSEHVLAAALREGIDSSTCQVEEGRAHTGAGVSGRVDGELLWLGRPDYVAAGVGLPFPAAAADFPDGCTVVALGAAGRWIGSIALQDDLRPSARPLCEALRLAGHRTAIFSGDAAGAVRAAGEALGVDEMRGGMMPEDKQQALLQLQGLPGAVVAMVGDGVNDAPVLAQAHVSVAMGGGTDLARNQADVVLLNEDLMNLERGLRIARRTLQVTRQNLYWAFAYNLGAVPLAMAGLITPWMAGIGMSASSLLVVLNALRLQRAG